MARITRSAEESLGRLGEEKEMRSRARKRKVNKESEILVCPRAEVRGALYFRYC